MFELRDYQTDAINKVVASMKQGNKSIMVQSPPRTGKTVIMAEIARRTTSNGGRVLFIVHRKEIVDQVKATFEQQGVNMQLAKIGMVQTLTRRVDKLETPSVIFVDEAHHALAKTYRRILDAFPNAIKLLFTATPYRLNGDGFTDIVDDLVSGMQIQELIDKGNLSPVDYYAPKEIDTKMLKKKRGEFTDDSIEKAFKPKIYGNAVRNFQTLASGKQAIAYTYNVDSAEKLAAEFNANGITAAAVSGGTPKDTRDQIINDYREGKIQIVTNAELFTEGLDLPNVDCVIMLRPTQSLGLYLQFAMRCMNPREGKTAVIIDHVGNVERFGLPTDDRHWTIAATKKKGGNSSSSDPVASVITCEKCFASFYEDKDGCCPFCGAELPKHNDDIEVVEDAELVKVESNKRLLRAKEIMNDELMNNVADKTIDQLNSYAELKAYAKLNGYKPGWAFYQAKNKHLIK